MVNLESGTARSRAVGSKQKNNNMGKKVKLAIEEIEIIDFIFHVVHHGEENPILLDRTPIGGFEKFFKERISEVIEGNTFYFKEDSEFEKELTKIEDNPLNFTECSKVLAERFHGDHDERIKPGVMILMKIRISNIPQYILIKYDHENVLTYTQDGKEAILKEISNTFSKNKTALQKSAIINFTEDIPTLKVVDKSNRKHITKFFQSFLNVYRKYKNADLTNKVKDAFLTTVQSFANRLPSDYTSRAVHIFYDLVQNNDTFERDTFLNKAFGEHHLPEMEDVFDVNLKKQDLTGEEFAFDKSIRKPREYKYKTAEGVIIQYTSSGEDTVDIKTGKEKNDDTIITIRTAKLIPQK
ncbi:MAG: nucleoid-associated protein [bacterium]|nr:nucleoid-associated protein [bacterium]